MKKNSVSHFAVKRIMTELRELKKSPCDEFVVFPLPGNIFEVHFTIIGPPDTEFEEGLYHGKLVFPTQYPYKPPDIILLTPNGRFETNKKICLNVTSYHKELWKPGWGIRTILLALVAFFTTNSDGIGSIKYPKHVRKALAKESTEWKCPNCKKSNLGIFKFNKPKKYSKKKKKKKKKKKNNKNKEEEEEEEKEEEKEEKDLKNRKRKKSKKNKKKKKRRRRKRKDSEQQKQQQQQTRRVRIPLLEEEDTIGQKFLNIFLVAVLLSCVYGVVKFGGFTLT